MDVRRLRLASRPIPARSAVYEVPHRSKDSSCRRQHRHPLIAPNVPPRPAAEQSTQRGVNHLEAKVLVEASDLDAQ